MPEAPLTWCLVRLRFRGQAKCCSEESDEEARLRAWLFHTRVIVYDLDAYASYSFSVRGTPLGQPFLARAARFDPTRTSKSAVSAAEVA
jgi:hypothetical protein